MVGVWASSAAMGAAPWNYSIQSPTWPPPTGYYYNSPVRPLEAVAGSNPANITLRIIEPGTYDIYRRVAGSSDWGASLANVTVTTGQTWTDNTVQEGVQYEYRILTPAPNPYGGYILAGVKVDKTQPKGRFVVVVTSDVIANLPTEYAQYKADLVADGWFVHEIITPRAADYTSNGTGANDSYGVPSAPFPSAHVDVRNQIIALYNQYPGEVKNLILLGKVTVPRSGLVYNSPDGHGNRGAIGADAYFADMDGIWTDTKSNAPHVTGAVITTGITNNPDGSVVIPSYIDVPASALTQIKTMRTGTGSGMVYSGYYSFTVAGGLLTQITAQQITGLAASSGEVNVVGDNKFDATFLSEITPNANVELGFGRVDMSSNIANEYEALRTYLNKAHRYKTASPDFLAGRRGVHRFLYDQPSINGMLAMPGVVGMDKLDFIRTSDLPVVAGSVDADAAWTAANGPDLFYFKGNSTPDFSDGGKAVIWTGLQSHWGYWFDVSTSSGQNVMQKRLSENNFTLSYTWSIFNVYYFYQRMGLGYDLGDMMRVSISSKSWASGSNSPYILPTYSSILLMNEMGDPSIRLFMFAPPTDLSVVSAGGNPSLSWTASRPPPADESQVIGYHIYRATNPAGPFTRLTSNPVTGTTYVDTSVNTGAWTYMVRAVRLETTGAGSYYNASLGTSQSINLTTGPSALQVSTTTLPDANWNTPYQATIAGQGGTPIYTWSLVSGSLPPGLSLSSNGVIAGTSTTAGTYGFTVRATDKAGVTADKALALTAQSNVITTLYPEADNFTTANSVTAVGDPYSDPWTKVAGPVYGYETFMRFDLSGVNVNNGLARAKLLLNIGDSTPIGSYALIKAALCADAGDGWSEATLNYNNRPADNPSFASIPATAFPVRYGTVEIDVTPFVISTLASDPSKKLTVRLFTTAGLSFTGYIGINSRFAPGNSRPRLAIESTNGPAITFTSPTVNPAGIHVGSSLVINATATAIPANAGALSVQWSKVSGPGTVTFSTTTQASTAASFSASGDYVLRLTANDGVLTSSKDLTVRVLAVPAATSPVFGAADTSLLVRLPFDEGTGISAANYSPASPANNGTLVVLGSSGLPTWVTTGKVGKALNFDGSGQRVEIPDSTTNLMDGIQKMSLSLWLNLNVADANNHAVVSKRETSSSSSTAFMLQVSTAKKLSATISNKTAVVGDNVLSAGQWYHVVMIFDGSQATNNLQLYLNGSPEKFGTVTGLTGNIIPRKALAPLRIGDYTNAALGGTSLGLNSMVDEVRLYNRVLTLDEIQDLAQAGPSNMGPKIALTSSSVSGPVGTQLALGATVTDDGLPGAVTLGWSKASGPGSVVFSNPVSGTTNATTSTAGSYCLRITANDGSITTFADVAASFEASGGIDSWRMLHFGTTLNEGNAADGAVLTRDGLANLLKYVLGLDPNVDYSNSPLAPKGQVENLGADDRLTFTFTRDTAVTDATLSVEVINDLASPTWTTIDPLNPANQVEVLENTPSAGLQTITVKDTQPVTANAKRFMRLKVTRP